MYILSAECVINGSQMCHKCVTSDTVCYWDKPSDDEHFSELYEADLFWEEGAVYRAYDNHTDPLM